MKQVPRPSAAWVNSEVIGGDGWNTWLCFWDSPREGTLFARCIKFFCWEMAETNVFFGDLWNNPF